MKPKLTSDTLLHYHAKWRESANEKDLRFVDSVYAICEKNYGGGGDEIVEVYAPAEILAEFKTLKEAKDYCGLRVGAALECRWGEDSDPELARWNRFKNWKTK